MNIIVDLEHTISNASHRFHLLQNETKTEFHDAFEHDAVNENMKMFINQMRIKNHVVIILTAKRERYREMVLVWLSKNDIEIDSLVMKPDDFVGHATEFKETFVRRNKYHIDIAFDDVGKNCAMFAKHNIPCLRIEQR